MQNIVDFLQKRGFIDAISSDELQKIVEKPIRVYLGFDPTADSLHIGHLVGIIALAWFQRFGHTPVVLLGGATAKIGDPSGRSSERPFLDTSTLNHNVDSIRKQFENFINFSDSPGSALLLNNDTWLGDYPLIPFLRDVGKHFRLGPMLSKDSVKTRLHSEEGISFTEFTYQVLQGYDFYYLFKEHDVCLEMGGSDQWGNITAGIELTRKLTGKQIFGLTYPLLTKSDGTKFGKSVGGAIWLSPLKTSPYQFYQYLVRVPDADVIQLMRMLTFIDTEEIQEHEKKLLSGDFVPNMLQKQLAEEVTRFVHGEAGLQKAIRVTECAAPGSTATLDPEVLEEIAHDMPNINLPIEEVLDKKYIDIASKIGLCSSKGEATRLIKGGGAFLNNEKIVSETLEIQRKHIIAGKYLLFGSGKRTKILVKVE